MILRCFVFLNKQLAGNVLGRFNYHYFDVAGVIFRQRVGCRCNVDYFHVILHTWLRWLKQNIDYSSNEKNTPITLYTDQSNSYRWPKHLKSFINIKNPICHLSVSQVKAYIWIQWTEKMATVLFQLFILMEISLKWITVFRLCVYQLIHIIHTSSKGKIKAQLHWWSAGPSRKGSVIQKAPHVMKSW